MSIDLSTLKMRVGDPTFSFLADGSAQVSLGWECYHAGLGDVLYSSAVTRRVPAIRQLEQAGPKLIALARSGYDSYVGRHEAISAIGGYSAHDADLILDGWWFRRQDGTYSLEHPVCGTFAGVSLDPTSFVSMVSAVLAQVLPPPTWVWAESTTPEELRVRCVAVAGATQYAVLNGNALLGLVPDAGWNALSVPAGDYDVRVCAVVGGQAGVPSFHMPVTVEAAGAMSVEPTAAVSLVADEEPRWWQRLRWWGRD